MSSSSAGCAPMRTVGFACSYLNAWKLYRGK
jgi:hypothetical protein